MSTTNAEKPRSLDPLIGATLIDRYRVERIIGRGGQGLVYLAEQIEDGRKVVLKLLAPQWLEDGTAIGRFAREGKRLQQLAHPNVVQMLECGHHGDQGFIAMEYLDGEPLRRYLGRQGRLGLQEFTPLASQILAAVGFAHDRGIMLRDIKPANIMLCERDGRCNFVKLLDFGLAKLVEGDDEEVTKSHVIGTAGYLAPEQIKGEPADLRVDVYAIGVLFYLMLAGESPIVGENDGALLYNHVHGVPKLLGEHLPDGHNVPELLIALIHQCLEKDPERRPADANEIAEALFECVPPKLFALPRADEGTRRALREYRDARDRGLERDDQPLQSSSEWTKPVMRTEGSPAEASSSAWPQPRRPTPADRPPQPPRRPTPPLPPRAGAAPPRGRAAAIGDRSLRPSDAALRTDDGVVRSDASGARTADATVQAGDEAPVREIIEAEADAPRRGLVPVRARSSASARADRMGIEPAANSAVPATEPFAPVTGAVPTLVADVGTGSLRREGSPTLAGDLGVRRRWLVAVGALAVIVGATAAWVMFMPHDSPPAASSPVAAASSAAGAANGSAKVVRAEVPPDEDAVIVVEPTGDRGSVEVRALAGARIEVDGREAGVAPRVLELGIGKHELRVIAPGHAPYVETIDVVAGGNPVVEPKLERKRKGAAIKVGATKAETPADDDGLGDEEEDVVDAEPLPDKPEPSSVVKPKPFTPPPPPDPSKNPGPFLPPSGSPSDDALLPTN